MTDLTLLNLWGIGVVPYSARGLTQTLEPIDAAGFLRRSINGKLVDLSVAQFQKYKSTITGSDQKPPACSGVWPGKQVTVDCISELVYPEYGTPERAVVAGSEYEEAGFVFYRPQLIMRVIGLQVQTDEWQAQVGWTMNLEEV
jgi:hypothetical protein